MATGVVCYAAIVLALLLVWALSRATRKRSSARLSACADRLKKSVFCSLVFAFLMTLGVIAMQSARAIGMWSDAWSGTVEHARVTGTRFKTAGAERHHKVTASTARRLRRGYRIRKAPRSLTYTVNGVRHSIFRDALSDVCRYAFPDPLFLGILLVLTALILQPLGRGGKT
jgi:hypothetical protein